MNVLGPPSVTMKNKTYVLDKEYDVELECQVSGMPEVYRVYWMKNNVEINIQNGNKYDGSTTANPSLTVKNMIFSDVGIYHCCAFNNYTTKPTCDNTTLEGIFITLLYRP